MTPRRLGLSGVLTRTFLHSPLTPLLLVAALVVGGVALVALPREEEPQISVPMVDILVEANGYKADDAAQLVTKPLEDIVKGVGAVDHVYSQTQDDRVTVTARFKVGTDEDAAILRIHEQVRAHIREIPTGIPEPVIIGRGINDVAIVVLTLSAKPEAAAHWTANQLFDMAQELRHELVKVDDVGVSYLVGGTPDQIRVEPDPERLALFGVTLNQVVDKVRHANRSFLAGAILDSGRSVPVVAGQTLAGVPDVGLLLLTTRDGRPVYLKDVAQVVVGAAPEDARLWQVDAGGTRPAVSLALTKRQGANAVVVAEQLLARVETLKGRLLPESVQVEVTRNYGETAQAKADELLSHLAIATVSIVALITLVLGWRAGLVVAVVIPTTILLTLFAAWVLGYTINRVSLFALIFSIGILVDDAIVVVENIVRHWAMPDGRSPADKVVDGVAEVGNPTIVATLTIVVALLPMMFVSGLMGPYMSPIPANASAAMLFSFFVAVILTPWLLWRVGRPAVVIVPRARRVPLRGRAAAQTRPERCSGPPFFLNYKKNKGVGERFPERVRAAALGVSHHGDGGRMGAFYRRVATPILTRPGAAKRFLAAVTVATVVACLAFPLKLVTVKLLPFDNKSELQVVLDLPEGSALETTERALGAAAARLASLPELTSMQAYAGTAAPFTFNGLVRHYFLRQDPRLGDLQINLTPKNQRARASHAIALEVRERLRDLDAPPGTVVKVVEVPPGPPVLSTLLAEIYGPDAAARRATAAQVRQAFARVDFVRDIDDSFGHPAPRLRVSIDHEALEYHGVEEQAVYDTLAALLGGVRVGYSQRGFGAAPAEITLRLPKDQLRAGASLTTTPVPARQGTVELGDVVRLASEPASYPVFRRDGRFVEMVTGELAGRFEAPLYGMFAVEDQLKAAAVPLRVAYHGQPADETTATLLWDGEWDITYVTFRDMGAAFAVAILGIYLLVVAQFGSFRLPLVILVPVPLTLIGIVVGHMLFHAAFTATSMIGFIALAGIIVRNSILLVDFIGHRRAAGVPLRQALLDAGAIRVQPIVLTAAAAMIGAAFILTDPIFQGLAISLIFGLASSTALTLLGIPALYVWLRDDGVPLESATRHG